MCVADLAFQRPAQRRKDAQHIVEDVLHRTSRSARFVGGRKRHTVSSGRSGSLDLSGLQASCWDVPSPPCPPRLCRSLRRPSGQRRLADEFASGTSVRVNGGGGQEPSLVSCGRHCAVGRKSCVVTCGVARLHSPCRASEMSSAENVRAAIAAHAKALLQDG